jgi:hypothetical protein
VEPAALTEAAQADLIEVEPAVSTEVATEVPAALEEEDKLIKILIIKFISY